jgi:hypothetical protein
MVDDLHWKRVSKDATGPEEDCGWKKKGIIVCNFLIFTTDASDSVMFVYLVIFINLIKLLSQFQ